MIPRFPAGSFFFLLVCLAGPAGAHPIPDVLVRSFFNADGSMVIRIEIDPRSFVEDPLNEPYVQNWVLGDMTEEERADLIAQAEDYVEKAVEIRFVPNGMIEPEFEWRFTGHDDAALEKIDDPVMLTGEWLTAIPRDLEGYQVHAHDYRTLSVYFLNHIRDQAVPNYQVLWPGETSKVLDLKELVASIPEPESSRESLSESESEPAPGAKPKMNVVIPLGIAAAVIPLLLLAMVLMKRRIG